MRKTNLDDCDLRDWKDLVDLFCRHATNDFQLPLSDYLHVLTKLQDLAKTVPERRPSEMLFAHVLNRFLAIEPQAITIAEMHDELSSDDFYAIGRSLVLGADIEAETSLKNALTRACCLLHELDFEGAADALLASSLLPKSEDPTTAQLQTRFLMQATAYMQAVTDCFPDNRATRTLSLMKIGEAE